MWVIPSRSRPANCARLLRRVATPGVLCVDDDDPCLDAYRALALPFSWRLVIGPRAGLAELYNRQFRAHRSLGWFGVGADDMLPESPDWDRRLVEVARHDGMAFGEDGRSMPTHFVIGGDLVREMGWLALPGLDRIFIDTTWLQIAKGRGVLRFLPDVKVTHMHPAQGLAEMDDTYSKHRKGEDLATYEAWRLSR